MNRRERVLTAANLGEPDRVPVDLLPNKYVEERLHRDLGTASDRELLKRLHVDVVDLRGVVDPQYDGPRPFSRDLGNGVRENIWGWRQKTVQTATGPEDSFVEFVLSDAETVEDLQQHAWPSPDWYDFSNFSARLEPWQDFAIMASGPSVFQHPTFLRGIDNLLMDMAIRPDMANFLMDKYTEFYLQYFDRMFTAAGGRIDILRVADDLGMQDGLMISMEMCRRYIFLRLEKLVDLAHAHGARLLFHSCGAIRPLIDDIIGIGVDILDPLQAAAEGMEPEGLKKDFGNRLCLHGGICTQHLLPEGTTADVREEVKRRIDILGEGGGYILAPCHVLQNDVPTDNILAMVETVC